MDLAADGEGLRIVHVFRSPVGGLFRHVRDLAAAQAARGCRVGLVCDSAPLDPAGEALLQELDAALPLGVRRMAMPRRPSPRDLVNALAFRRLCADLKPDVVHGHGAKGGVYARLPFPTLGRSTPLRVYTPHGGSVHYADRRVAGALFRLAETALAPATDVFLFESQFVADAFNRALRIPAGRQVVSPNGLHPHEFAPVAPAADAADFVYVGELRELKGIDLLIDALAEVERRTGRDVTAAIVGAGCDRAALEARAQARGLGARVVFPGRLPAAEAFRRGRVLVVPSRRESLPYVVLEAAAAGVPMVATSAGGIPEIFGPQAARLARPGDLASLADAMERMQRLDAAARAAEAEDLKAHVRRRFSLAAMVDGAMAAYRAGLSGRTPARDAERPLASFP